MKVTVIVERKEIPAGPGPSEVFKVIRVKNSLSPKVGEELTASEVKDLIDRRIEVVVDLPRRRGGA